MLLVVQLLAGSCGARRHRREIQSAHAPADEVAPFPHEAQEILVARADLIKQLIRSHTHGDDATFRQTALQLAAEERDGRHPQLASQIERLVRNGGDPHVEARGFSATVPSPPDGDRRRPLLEVRKPDRYLADLILDDVTLGAVERMLREVRGWHVLEAHGLRPTQRVLFCGPSGCGKTATAEAIAAELALPLMVVRFDAVVSSLLGETAANLRRVFDYASSGQWVMLFDEFDAIGRSRDDATEHGEIKRVVNSFLQILDGLKTRSFIIAATNFEQALDPAIWRRFDDVLRFGMPTPTQVGELLGRLLGMNGCSPSHERRLRDALGSSSHAEVERVALDIRKRCSLEGRTEIEREDVDDAIERHAYRVRLMSTGHSEAPPHIDHG